MAEQVEFFNGIKMPSLGLGTWQATGETVMEAVNIALSKGYRHIDTSYMYGNEEAIGEALKIWFDSGRIKREELFIVTKIPVVGNRDGYVEKYLKKSLKALQLSYIDLFLIHHPCGHCERSKDPWLTDGKQELLPDLNTDHIRFWKAMEAQVDAGRARAIGLSSFNQRQIKGIVKAARIQPAVIQAEIHLYYQQKGLVAFCKSLDITVCAYGPLGSPGLIGTRKKSNTYLYHSETLESAPLANPVVGRIAEKYHKTPAQILLRHILQRGIAAIPKSVNPTRINENFHVFDFILSEADMEELNALDKGPAGRIFGTTLGFSDPSENPFLEPF